MQASDLCIVLLKHVLAEDTNTIFNVTDLMEGCVSSGLSNWAWGEGGPKEVDGDRLGTELGCHGESPDVESDSKEMMLPSCATI